MAKVPTPKESANLILQRFKINHLRAGDMVLTGPLLMAFQQEGFTSEDLQNGLDYAQKLNWIEIDNTTVFLTDEGFTEMER
jgi:hypothetical protein